jgi:hypothetical protein
MSAQRLDKLGLSGSLFTCLLGGRNSRDEALNWRRKEDMTVSIVEVPAQRLEKLGGADGITVSRVYQYGTVPERIAPVYGVEAAEVQLKLANRLWNTLVAIERTRMERYRKIMHDEGQERIDQLREKIAALREELKARRQKARKRTVEDKDLKEALAQARHEIGNAIQDARDTQAARRAEKKPELERLSERSKHRIKRARQASASMGLFWGSYNDVVGRADTGRKAGELQFRRSTGDGTLTAQIIGGTSVERTVGGDHSFFQMDSARPGQKWRRARMRIGSTAERGPVWLDIPVVYHREIPADAKIKSVSMTRRRGVWRLNVTVTLPAPTMRVDGPVIAVDIGYRLKPEGVRVAYWVDSDGNHGEALVGQRDLSQFERVRSLRSTCDRMREEMVPVLAEWLKDRNLGEEWQRETVALIQWRSGDRVARLICWWGDHRLEGDGEIYEAARTWRKQYLHLAHWWRDLEDQMRMRLREQYRVFAKGVARDYRMLCIEEFDLRAVAEKPQPEADGVRTESSGQRQIVAPSVFRAALENACRREGVAVEKLPAAYTTAQCHVCKELEEWDQAVSIQHRCGKCGTLWDQDFNAAKNLLEMGLESGGGPDQEKPKRVRKWDRVRERLQKTAEEGSEEKARSAAG